VLRCPLTPCMADAIGV